MKVKEGFVLGRKEMKRIIKRIFVILVLVSLILLQFQATCFVSKDVFWSGEYGYAENLLYMLFALLIGTIYKFVYEKLNRRWSKIVVSLALATAFTVSVFFLNNYFHYLLWNDGIFGGRYLFTYDYFLKYDLNYNVGLGECRYLIVFIAMCVANFAIIAYFKWIQPMTNKFFGMCFKGLLKCAEVKESDEEMLEYRLQRLLIGADHIDFIDEINGMKIDAETKNVFKKLIDKYDNERETIELYQALFVRYGHLLSREEYLEYRQRYVERFKEPLPEKCVVLDELHTVDC